MTRLAALWTAFLASYEVQWMRAHAVLLTVCGAVIVLAAIAVRALQ